MTKKDAIKYLQQLYPNGGHCWLDEQRIEAIDMAVKALQEETISEDLGDYINELSKQFQEVSFAKLSRIAVRVAKWQKEQFEKNRLAACDRQTEEEAEREQDFVMGIIENEHRKPTFNDAIKYGMRLNKEQMMKDTVEAKVYNKAYPTEFEIETNTFMQKLKHGDNVKLIIIKEN